MNGGRAVGGHTEARPESMMRVFATSSGVVTAAANPPAMEPHRAASVAGRSRTSPDAVRRRASASFIRSYSGNWMHVNGTCNKHPACQLTASGLEAVRGVRGTCLAGDGGGVAAVEASHAGLGPYALGHFPAPDAFDGSLTALLHDLCRDADQACGLDRATGGVVSVVRQDPDRPGESGAEAGEAERGERSGLRRPN